MTTHRINRNLYRYAEEALMEYPRDVVRLRAIKEYLTAPIGYELVQGGEIVAEQERVLHRMCQNQEYRTLSTRVQRISLFLDTLDDDEYRLVDLRYLQGLPWSRVADEMHLSPETCRIRRAPRVVIKAARVLFGDL